MKALRKMLLVAVLVVGLTGVAMAITDTSNLTVTVSSIDLLAVDNATTGITLNGTAGSSALTGADDTTAKLNYTHNSATSKKITAEVTTDPSGDDITLKVTVNGGAGIQTICTAGTATEGGAVVYTGITAGAITNADVTYNATATTATPTAGYDFVITYTSADVS